jgi:tail-anchored protein insertion receptor
MFWLEKGWVPHYIEWLLCFPRAPIGSISIQVWTTACGAVIQLVSAALVSVYGLLLQQRTRGEKAKIRMAAGNQEKEVKKDL